ncbi:MAG: hypothetical protein HY842_01835 [Bacteroidetes bacterium]|nr:hypothetical protein [Bacteroidota bacterium]
MQFKFLFSLLLLVSVATAEMTAQTSTSVTSSPSEIQNSDNIAIGNEDWTFYLDQESKVYYIDFETISVNLSDIRVYNEAGDVVMTDKLWDLPVNAIYEINLTDFDPGTYKIELRSYTGVIRKDMTLSE